MLVCPFDHTGLKSLGSSSLRCATCDTEFSVRAEIPRFLVTPDDQDQAQVQSGFAFKWTRDEWGFAPAHIELMRRFFWTRFGFESESDVAALFGGKSVLHAGIGSGQTEQHYLSHCKEVWGVDISESVDACRKNWNKHYPDLSPKLKLTQADLMSMPFKDESFDVVVSDGVLHHTPDTFAALRAVTAKVKNGGHVIFYVYKKKPPIREFVDNFVRGRISELPPEEAWKQLEPLTAFAKETAAAGDQLHVPQDIDLLELKAGQYDLQRWLYWNVMKFYWNDALSFDENNHLNFDWYYPKYAWRHTPEEVQAWLGDLDLHAEHFQAGDAGISVIARKASGR